MIKSLIAKNLNPPMQTKYCWGCGNRFLTFPPGHPQELEFCGEACKEQEVPKIAQLKQKRDRYLECAEQR